MVVAGELFILSALQLTESLLYSPRYISSVPSGAGVAIEPKVVQDNESGDVSKYIVPEVSRIFRNL